ncbi:MAG: hypothetical protein V4754_07620 [Pseudomonadota bacterium]
MSIAVSLVLRPAFGMRCCMALWCGGACAAAVALGRGAAVGAYALAWPGAAVSVAAALFLLTCLCQNRTAYQLDISGVGQLRLAVYQEGGSAAGPPADLVRLMPGSTLWPGFLLLRFRTSRGALAVPVWPGAVPGDGFRALSLACRAIAARGGDSE